jgi:hypothetical protein
MGGKQVEAEHLNKKIEQPTTGELLHPGNAGNT